MLLSTKNSTETHRSDLLYKEEVYAIIGAAFETQKSLGVGFLEPVYQESFEIELKERKIPFVSQPELQIFYKGIVLNKKYRADLLIYDKIIVELKAINHLSSIEEAQLFNYLKATKLQVGLLINFGNTKLERTRRVLTQDQKDLL